MDSHKAFYTWNIIILIACVLLIFFSYQTKDKQAELVINGDLTLMCEIKGKGVTQIEPDKITGREDGYWVFVNGKAKSCYVD